MRNTKGCTLLGAITLSIGALLLAAPAATAVTPATATSGYHVIDLGTLGGSGTAQANAINDHGHVVGESNGRAVLWRNGRIIDLGTLPGGMGSVARDLNERDEVVGASMAADGMVHAFVWRNGRMRDLGVPPGDDDSYARAINDAGQIVGCGASRSGNEPVHAVRWQAGRMIDLDPGGQYSCAYDNTNDGLIVGVLTPPGEDPFIFATVWRHDVPTILAPGVPSLAAAVNDRHQVVGHRSSSEAEAAGAFVWSRGVFTALGNPSGANNFQATDINNKGQIAGLASSDAVLWSQGTFVLLPRLAGSPWAQGFGINNRGQIVGQAATTPDGLNPHAVLWTR